jgi:DivIVA domain-containing protein
VLTALFYLLIMAVIAVCLFFAASAVFGRGEQAAPLPPGTTPTYLPLNPSGEDVRAMRFQLVLRGYKASEVDWALGRLADDMSDLRLENARLRAALAHEEDLVADDAARPEDGNS